MTPNDRKYSKEHEWILVEGGLAKIGITDHAQDALGDIVFVELPAVGDSFAAGDSFGVVESVKAVSNIYTPVAGEVVAINEALEGEPELINTAPYENFLVQLKIESLDESALLCAEEYEAFVTQEA